MHACFPVTEIELNMQYFATAGSNPLKLETCDTKTSNSPIYEYYVRNCNLYSQFIFPSSQSAATIIRTAPCVVFFCSEPPPPPPPHLCIKKSQ